MMTYPVFNQRNYNERLGTEAYDALPDYTIAGYGCALACVASVLKWFGKNTDPSLLNRDLIAINGFADNGQGSFNLIKWPFITKLYSDVRLAFNQAYPTTPADMNVINNYLDRSIPVIVGVSIKHDPRATSPDHYVVIHSRTSNGAYLCMDPWFGDDTVYDGRYAVNGLTVAQSILQVVVFEGPAPVSQMASDAQKIPVSQMASDAQKIQDELRSARDANWVLYQEALKKCDVLTKQLSDQAFEFQTKVTQLNEEYNKKYTEVKNERDTFEGKVKELEEQNEKLLKDNKRVLDANTTLSKLYKTTCEEDSQALDDSIKANEQLKKMNWDFEKIATLLGTKPNTEKIMSEIDTLIKQRQEIVKRSKNYFEDLLKKFGLSKGGE